MLIVILFAALTFGPDDAHAQANGLKVTIFRPGEGEAIYSSSSPPYAAIPVTGMVAAADVSMSQLQVRLEILRSTQLSGSATTTPKPDGTFAFDVGINQHPVTDLAEAEQGCDSRCHQMQTLTLPAGPVLLRVTVSDPLGRKAIAQRSIVVDYSGHTNLPVQVVVDGAPGHALSGVKVIAATRLYEWRAREFSALTDATGRAIIHLERLSEEPTTYVLHIEPRIVDGALVTNRNPISVTLPAGANSVAPVTILARTQQGQVNGTIDTKSPADTVGLIVRAIELPAGATHTGLVAQGKFGLTNLPLAKYLLTLVDTPASARNWADPQMIDLGSSPTATTTLKLESSTQIVRGAVHDPAGNPIPFAWVAAEGQAKTARVAPASGQFALGGLTGADRALWVTAPGYYGRPIAVGDRVDVALSPLPNLRTIPWGSGAIAWPFQTLADTSSGQISIQRGWIWGQGTGSFSIRTPEADIMLLGGSFALEFLPGETNWLYLHEGQAQIVTGDGEDAIAVNARQMVAFGRGISHPTPVVLDDAVVQALHWGEKSRIPIETDPAFAAHLLDEIERRGLAGSQALVLAVILTVALVIGMVVRRRRRIHPIE